jgi:COMPASS component SPP1
VQERIPGVALFVAWSYLSQPQKQSFKDQARDILRKLHTIFPPPSDSGRSYVVPDPDPVRNRGIQELERDIIFAEHADDPDVGFMHNDVSQSNLIVDKDKIVGLVDWEMAGFFGWKTAEAVALHIRGVKREHYAALNLPEERLRDIMFWNDLYVR